MRLILLIDFGSTYTKLTAINMDDETIVATAKSPTTVETHIMNGLNAALDQLERKLNGIDYEIIDKISSSSAAGGLRMSAIGLVPTLTLQAANTALLSSGAKLASYFAYEMVEEDVDALIASCPDIVLLTGGTDGGNQSTVLHNAAMLAKSSLQAPIIMAGNRSVRRKVIDILAGGGKEVIPANNVLPELDRLEIDSVRQIIRNLFTERIIQAKGIDEATEYVKKILMPTPIAVLRAAKLIAVGTQNERGLGDLIVVDIGGATTDVHSIGEGLPQEGSSVYMKGIPEPFDKRTVEGDLGVRFNAKTILETVGVKVFAENLKLPEKSITDWVEKISSQTETLPGNSEERLIDIHLAYQACRLSVTRHVGHVENYYTPTGATYAQYGKDMTAFGTVIGTGGPLVHLDDSVQVLEAVLFNKSEPERLRPKDPVFYLDAEYILYAVGLLVEEYPDLALHIAKKYLKRIP